MSWIRVDDRAPSHPKFLAAGPVASWLWVCGQGYCNHYLTDGFIPVAALATFPVPKVQAQAQILVSVGLWEAAVGGYHVHDYLEYQVSKADVLAKKGEDRQRKQGVVRTESERIPNGFQTDSNWNPSGFRAESERIPSPRAQPRAPVPSHPIPSQEEEHKNVPADGPPAAAEPDLFDRFWAAYPRKTARAKAQRVFQRLRVDEALLDLMLEAIGRQCAWPQWRKDHGEFIPHASTWLHGRRWDDEAESHPAPDLARALGPTYASDWYVTCPHDPKCDTEPMCHTRRRILDMLRSA